MEVEGRQGIAQLFGTESLPYEERKIAVEADKAYQLLVDPQTPTNLYVQGSLGVLRSEDRGKTWTVLPDKRPGGWYLQEFERMDELRPINLGGGAEEEGAAHHANRRLQSQGKEHVSPEG